MPKAVGIDLGTTNSVVASSRPASPSSSPTPRAAAPPRRSSAFSKTGEVLVGEVAKRQAITNPDRTIRSVKRHMGTELDDRHRRQEVHRAGDQRPHPAEAEARRRGLPRRHRHPGRHHRARVLRRRPAHGHQGGRPDRRPRGAAHHQRAHRGRARLRPRQGGHRPDDPRVRPRRRHVRRVGPRDRRRRVRGEVHPRRHPPRRRRLGPAGHRLAGRASSRTPTASTWRNDKMAVQRLKEAAEKAKIELSPGAGDPDQPAVHHRHDRRPAAPRRAAHPGQVPGAHRRPARALPAARSSRRSRTPASPRARSTT